MLAAAAGPPAVTFTTTGRLDRRLRAEWQARSSEGKWWLANATRFIGIGIICFNAIVAFRRLYYGQAIRTIDLALMISVPLALVVLAISMAVRRRRDKDVRIVRHIAFTSEAIELTTSGSLERIRWYAIEAAFDLPSAYAIARRDDSAHPVLIPKSALPDGDTTLWTFLEDRLTGRRPRIRELGFPPPKHFENTVDQFLTDRGLVT